MKHFFVVSGGNIDDAFVNRMLEQETPEAVIAADKGMSFFYRNQKMPDVIIGDFDSVDHESLQYFKAQRGVQMLKLNPVKDDTDTEAAIRYALEHGAEQITLLGATGSRLDHVLGNIELLGIGLQAGVPIVMTDANNRIRMIDRGIVLKKEAQHGTYVSLIPYTEKVEHLTLRGFKYPLADAILTGFCSLGVSNEIVDAEAEIIFDGGILLVIESRD